MLRLSRFNYRTLMALAATILLSVICSTSFAQRVNSTVNGTVKDQAGAVVSGVKVTLIDAATNREVTATTNEQGSFVFSDVRAGSYKIVAERDGFKKSEVPGIQVNVDTPATVNLELQTGQIIEVVTTAATDAQAVVNSENATIQTTVLERQINDLPLNGRNPLALAGLQAGVNTAGDNRTASINGTRGTFSNITWDGINVNDNFIRTDSLFAAAAPSVPSVSEFTLTTQNGSAADGLGVAQVKLVTPRGSTAYHGSVFNYLRNDALDANDFFNNAAGIAKPKLIQNQFGGNVGGPLPLLGKIFGPRGSDPKKLFFYAYYEGTRQRTQESVLQTVLTPSARQGTFTYQRADNGQLQTVNLLTLGGLPADPTTRSLIGTTPLPNDFSSADLANTALANTAGFRFNTASGSRSDLWGFRTDFELSQRHRFETIFSRFTFDLPNDPFNGANEPFPGRPGGGQASSRPRLSTAWNWTPTTSLNNELRAGFFKQDVDFFTNEKLSAGYRLTFPIITDPILNFEPQGRKVDNYDLTDNANWVKGNHQVQFGGSYRRVYLNPFNNGGVLPLYSVGFNDIGTVNPLRTNLFPGGISSNDFDLATGLLAILAGPIAQADQTFNVTSRTSGFVKGAGERQKFVYYGLAGYGSDTWRIRPNLSLTLGLRYEYISVPTETRGIALLPRNTGLDALRDPNAVLDFAGAGTSRPFFNSDRNNFAPSIGLAWDPFGNGKTSIRAGYSISYVIDNNITTLLNAAVRGNDGLQVNATVADTTGTVSNGGLAPVPVPQFKVPRTIAENLALSPTTALFTIDPNLKTPYIQQWNLSLEREIFRDTVLEVRYVGNHGVKLTRGVDINQLRVLDNGFLTDFQRAQRNLAANGNPAVGEALQVFPKLGLGGFLDDSGVRNLIRQGQIGALAEFYVQFRDFFLTPDVFGTGSQLSPSFFLRANPNTFVADFVGNGSFSNYHGLQAEVRKRLRNGLYFQLNYTFSKAYTDFEGSQANFAGLLDLGHGTSVEKSRIANDITHVFKANGIYELPFGPGKRFGNTGGLLGKAIGGWSLNGIFRTQSGVPISIVSGRGTLNRAGRSGKNTVNTSLTASELQKLTGLFKDTNGNPILFDPKLIGSDGRGNTQFLQNPVAGTIGTLALTPVSGPGYFNVDLSLIKRTAITEKVNVEFRADAFNVFNHVNFDYTGGQAQNINSQNFGRLNSTFEPRILQFALKLNF